MKVTVTKLSLSQKFLSKRQCKENKVCCPWWDYSLVSILVNICVRA